MAFQVSGDLQLFSDFYMQGCKLSLDIIHRWTQITDLLSSSSFLSCTPARKYFSKLGIVVDRNYVQFICPITHIIPNSICNFGFGLSLFYKLIINSRQSSVCGPSECWKIVRDFFHTCERIHLRWLCVNHQDRRVQFFSFFRWMKRICYRIRHSLRLRPHTIGLAELVRMISMRWRWANCATNECQIK